MNRYEYLALYRILQNENVRRYALQELTTQNFLTEKGKDIFAAVEKVATNGEFDLALVAGELKEKGHDGHGEISDIITNDFVLPGDGNAVIDQLKRESKKQKINDQLNNFTGDPDELPHLIDQLSSIDSDDNEIDIFKQVEIVRNDIAQAKELGRVGYPTPFKSINHVTGGLQLGHLWIIGGRTSAGKTTMGITLLWHFLKEGAKVAYFSTEIQSTDLIIKCAAHETGIPFLKIKSGKLSEDESESFDKSLKHLSAFTPHIIDTYRDISKIRSRATLIKQSVGLDVVIIDFAQNLRGSSDMYTRMTDVAISAQELAVRLRVGTVMFSQLSNEMATTIAGLKAGQSPSIVSFKGSGELGNAPDVAILLRKRDHQVDYWVVKTRYGSLIKGTFEFINHYTSLKEVFK